jgi:hypothetical protein
MRRRAGADRDVLRSRPGVVPVMKPNRPAASCREDGAQPTVRIYDYSPKLLRRDGGPLLLRDLFDEIQDTPPDRGAFDPREGLHEREPVRCGEEIGHIIESKRVVIFHRPTRRAIE